MENLNMRHQQCFVVGLALMLVGTLSTDALAAGKDVKFSKEWKGSVADQKLENVAGDCITSKKSLEKVWTAWKIKDKMPDVDFDKEIVVAATTVGSHLNLTARLDDQGDLQLIGMATLDFGEG